MVQNKNILRVFCSEITTCIQKISVLLSSDCLEKQKVYFVSASKKELPRKLFGNTKFFAHFSKTKCKAIEKTASFPFKMKATRKTQLLLSTAKMIRLQCINP